jgi:sporulation protein YabP
VEDRKTAPETKLLHNIFVDCREKIVVTGVDDVESFDEENVVVYTSMGVLTIRGANFKINKLSVEDGELTIEGDVDSMVYSDNSIKPKRGIFAKFFK